MKLLTFLTQCEGDSGLKKKVKHKVFMLMMESLLVRERVAMYAPGFGQITNTGNSKNHNPFQTTVIVYISIS